VKRATFLGKPAKELRRFIRIVPGQPIPVRLPDGTVREDIVYDISPAGMQLRCNEATAKKVHPLDEPLGVDDLPRIDLQITLPVTGKNEALSVKCKLCFVKNMPDDTVGMGVFFEQFEGDLSEDFQQFIQESLEPPADPLERS
jgi:hypothetical protein